MTIRDLFFLISLSFFSVTLNSQNNADLKSQVEKNFENFSTLFYEVEISILFYLEPKDPEIELIGSVCPKNKTNSYLQNKIDELGGSSYSVTLKETVHSISDLKRILEKELNYNCILSIHYSGLGEKFFVKKYLIE